MRFESLDIKDGEKYVTLTATPEIWRDILGIVDSYSHFGPELRSYTTILPRQAQTAREELQKLVNTNQSQFITSQDIFNTIQVLVREYDDFGYGGLKKITEKDAKIDKARYSALALECREVAEQMKAAS